MMVLPRVHPASAAKKEARPEELEGIGQRRWRSVPLVSYILDSRMGVWVHLRRVVPFAQ